MKIWYDLSGIYGWRGNFTGIQRAVYNIGKELQRSDAERGFFIFRYGSFQEVGFEEVEARLKAQAEDGTLPPDDYKPRRSIRTIQHHAMVGLKGTIRGSVLEPPLYMTYGVMRRTYRSMRSGSTSGRRVSSPFRTGDAVVVVDGNWQFAGYAQALLAAKRHRGFKLVHFVHDLTAVKNPALASKGAERIIGEYFQCVFPAADLLVADSRSTKDDVHWFAQHFDLPDPAVSVITLGDTIAAGNISRPKATIPKPFILAVGTIEIRKNYPALYYAYRLAKEQHVELPHLVIVGRKGWMAEEAFSLLTEDREIRDNITILRRASDQELEWLYQNCLFTVFPSFYEGWGLPVAESFAHGKVCVSSDTSSMPEVGGDLAVYVSPYNTEQLMKTIAGLSSSPENLKRLEDKVHKGYRPRHWSDTSHDLLRHIGRNFT